MSEQRERPQFGEYATPEEQLARIQSPSPEQLAAHGKPVPTSEPEPAPARTARRASLTDPEVLAANRRQFNMVGTIAFLAYGLVEVVTTVPLFLRMSLLLNDQLTILSQTIRVEFAPAASSPLTERAGWVLIAVWTVLWLGAALLAWRRIVAGKLALWVPFAFGVAAYVVTATVTFWLLFQDPTVGPQLWAAIFGIRGN